MVEKFKTHNNNNCISHLNLYKLTCNRVTHQGAKLILHVTYLYTIIIRIILTLKFTLFKISL